MSRKASVIRIVIVWTAALLLGYLAAEDRLGLPVPHVLSLSGESRARLWVQGILMLAVLITALPVLVRSLTGVVTDPVGGLRLPAAGILLALLYSGCEMIKCSSEPSRNALVQYEWAAFPLAVLVTLNCLGLGNEDGKITAEERKKRNYVVVIYLGIVAAALILWKFAGKKSNLFLVRMAVGALISSVFIVWERSGSAVTGLKREILRDGFRIHGDSVIRNISESELLVLDKTGIVAEGEPAVVTVIPFGKCTREDVLFAAARAEYESSGSYAAAIFDAYRSLRSEDGERSELVRPGDISGDFAEEAGLGVRFTAPDGIFHVGNAAWLTKEGITAEVKPELLKQMNDAGQTVIYVCRESKAMGVLGISDRIRPEAGKDVAELASVGLTVKVLTGDDRQQAELLGKRLKAAEVMGPLNSTEKAALVRELSEGGKKVVAAGLADRFGAALKEADTAFAVGELPEGTEESFAVTAESGELQRLRRTLVLIRRTARRLRVVQAAAIAFSCLMLLITCGTVWLLRGQNVSPMQLSLAVLAFRLWEGIYLTKR